MLKQEANNSFNDGLQMDMNPLITPNNVMTSCLNGTLITYNGNEYMLQNDMGNGRVETAMLPEGYIPLGTCELGGIIYVVSYNPLINKSQIGSFPSPERNILSEEISERPVTLSYTKDFGGGQKQEEEYKTSIDVPLKRLILLDTKLNPGDLFKIYTKSDLTDKNIPGDFHTIFSAYNNSDKNPNLDPRYLKLNVMSIQDDGTVSDLTDTVVWGEQFYINKQDTTNSGELSVDTYRKLVGDGYTPFTSKTSGKLGILAELECIDNFDVAWDAIKDSTDSFKFYFYTNWEYKNDQAKNKINLYGIRVDVKQEGGRPNITYKVIENYPIKTTATNEGEIIQSGTDILQHPNDIFLNPPLANIDDDTSPKQPDEPRKNDGSDNQFLINPGISLPVCEGEENCNNVYEFTVYPMMPFGTLTYMPRTFTIDLSKLGSGQIDLKEYRYYYNTNSKSITLNWGLEAYPHRHKQIDYVRFNFYRYSDVKGILSDNSKEIQNDSFGWIEDKEGKEGEFITNGYSLVDYIEIKQSSYSGNFIEEIPLKGSKLEEFSLYLVEIKIRYNGATKVYYRFMYTTDIFNSQYLIKDDYKDVILQDVLFDKNNVSYNLDLGGKLISSEYHLYEDKSEIDKSNLAYFIKDLEQDDTKEYKIKQNIGISYTPKIICRSKFKNINIDIQDIEQDEQDEQNKLTATTGVSVNTEQTWLNLNDSEFLSGNLQDIQLESSSVNLHYGSKTESELILNNYFNCYFNKQESVEVKQQLTKLTRKALCVHCRHVDKGTDVFLKEGDWTGQELSTFSHHQDTELLVTYPFSSELTRYLSQYDIVELNVCTSGKDKNANQCVTEHTDSFGLRLTEDKVPEDKNKRITPYYKIYVLQHNSEIYLFVFRTTDGNLIQKDTTINSSQFNNTWGYFKISDSSGVPTYGYTCSVLYYPETVANIIHTIDSVTVNPKLSVGNQVVEKNSTIHNLNYGSHVIEGLEGSIDVLVSASDYIKQLSLKNLGSYTLLPNGKISSENFSSRQVYKENTNGSYEIESNPNGLSLSVTNGVLRLNSLPGSSFKEGRYRSEEEKNGDMQKILFPVYISPK